MDQRTTPPPDQITMDKTAQVRWPIVDLTRGRDGPRNRQLLYGDAVTVLNTAEGHSLIRSRKDGYCGTVPSAALGETTAPTHRVTARATQAYSAPDIKSRETATLSFGASLAARGQTATFIETELGFLPRQHVHPTDAHATDPVSIAEMFLGTPYLWGGNSFLGIDCSGLVQASLLACGIPCPGDSDQQEAQVGETLPPDAPLQRNDLMFWKGHVAQIADSENLIHANAGYMAVVYEPIEEAIARIRSQGDGEPTGRRRPSLQ